MGLVSINTNVDALNAGRFFNQNIANLSKANAQLASGRIDSDASEAPAAAAVGASLTSAILAQTQAASNVTQACALISLASGSLSSMTQILQTMKARATQANSDTIGPSQRAMLNEEYQALLTQVDLTAKTSWNGVPLFTGGSGEAKRLANSDASGITSPQAPADISATFALTGFVSGPVQSVAVQSSGENAGAVDVTIGGQSFKGSLQFGATGNVQLTSTTDTSNTLTLNITGTGLTSTSAIRTELNSLFQLDIGNPISMRSESSDLSATITSTNSGASTRPETYGLSYGYNDTSKQITYKISDGLSVWEKSFDAFSETNATLNLNARTVVFDNGFTVTTAANTDETHPTAGIEIITVDTGNKLTMGFQVGDSSSERITIEFSAATASALNITGTSIADTDSASATGNILDVALTEINNMAAKLGGTKTQLNFTGQSLELQIQNEKNAKSTFTDADITTALENAQASTALVNMSSTIFQNTLQQPKKLAELVQTVMR